MKQNRVLVAVAAALALLFAVDFFQRIYVPRHSEARGEGSYTPAAVPAALPISQIVQEMSSWLPDLKAIAPDSGRPQEVEWTLTLRAVFGDRTSRFAVIEAKPAASGKSQFRRVNEGDDLFGFKVTNISPLVVSVTGKDGDRQLELFKSGKATPVRGAGPAAGPAGVGGRGMASGVALPADPAVPQEARKEAPGSAQSGPVPATKDRTGPRTVETRELNPGDAFQLPESMRGMKIVKTPPAPGTDAAPAPASQEPTPQPRKP